MAQHCTVTLYGLSTCSHCRRAREYLEENEVEFNCVYVDKLEGDERASVIETVRKLNPRLSFPTILVSGASDEVIVGFEPDKLDKAIEL